MPTYSASIVREQGGSVLSIGSQGILQIRSGGCQTFNFSGVGAQTVGFTDATRTATISIGREVPTHSASPGSLFIRSDGSVSNWYYNISTGTTGSVWRAAASG